MLFYIKAKVSISVRGISGESQEGVSRLVNADNRNRAKEIFEDHCRESFKNMAFDRMRFEYLEIAHEI
jgi:hypothetical protein